MNMPARVSERGGEKRVSGSAPAWGCLRSSSFLKGQGSKIKGSHAKIDAGTRVHFHVSPGAKGVCVCVCMCVALGSPP